MISDYKKGDRLRITRDPNKEHVIPVDHVTVLAVYKKTHRLKVLSDYGFGYMIGIRNLKNVEIIKI